MDDRFWDDSKSAKHGVIGGLPEWYYKDRFCHDREFAKRISKECAEAEERVADLRKRLEGWGFFPFLDNRVRAVINKSGYRVWAKDTEGTWTVEVTPMGSGKFDSSRAKNSLDELDSGLEGGWISGGAYENEEILHLATQLAQAVKSSLQRHGDFRDAVKEMGDYELRDRSHPNSIKRGNLQHILWRYLSTREQYKDEVDQHREATPEDESWWGERIEQFRTLAAEYVATQDAHTRWLAKEISAWLLRPYLDLLARGARTSFVAQHGFIAAILIGLRVRQRWRVGTCLAVSGLSFLLCASAAVGCYLFMAPTAAYILAGICGLMYARRYLQARRFWKGREKLCRVQEKVSDLYREVESGKYNTRELIRRFREIEAEGFRPPSIFVSAIESVGGNHPTGEPSSAK
jgi:hypothetical protein